MREVWVIVGPTAVGKSSLALALAERADGEIVNADALQVYRGLDIGTAKPTIDERRRVPHYLLDILEPHETFSAGEFARRAREVLEEIFSRRRQPILVGGSGFYLQTLLDGISPLPEVNQGVRDTLVERLREGGLAPLWEELREVDSKTAERLAPADRQRILRALEIWHGTGRPLSAWIEDRAPTPLQVPNRRIGLTVPRTLLYDLIEERVEAMLAAGWVEEVRSLLDNGYTGAEPAFQAIGYRQIVAHIRDGESLTNSVVEIVRATRRYAKRQLTWFRRDRSILWFTATERGSLVAQVMPALRAAIEGGSGVHE